MFSKKILLGAAALFAAAAMTAPAHADGEAKNVIFFLGDGMGPTVVTAARIYRYGEDGKLVMESLPRTARVRTYSNDAQTTDSAPSMAAYMTGVKMNNDVISMTPETQAFNTGVSPPVPYQSAGNSSCPATGNGRAVTTILEIAKARGLAVGAVTTTRVTHATPAATYAHVCNRDAESTIAAQAVPGGAGYNAALGNGLDVLLGGGFRYFTPNTVTGGSRTDGRDLTAELQAAPNSYTYVTNRAALNALTPTATTRVVGLFNRDHMNFDADRPATEPSLAEMTSKAIDVLAAKGTGYFLMVEGGRIDQALHPTFARRAMQDTIAFDEAIRTALGKVNLANTLIVVTADHDHTLTLNGYAKRTGPSTDANGVYARPGILGLVKNVVTGNNDIDADGQPYTNLIFGNGENRTQGPRTAVTDATAAGLDYHQEAGVRMGSGSETHGSGDVMLMATGAGSDKLGFKGTMVNTRVFELLRRAYGF
ncbi:MAG: alkaline phosphatase [Nevskia sp.]